MASITNFMRQRKRLHLKQKAHFVPNPKIVKNPVWSKFKAGTQMENITRLYAVLLGTDSHMNVEKETSGTTSNLVLFHKEN